VRKTSARKPTSASKKKPARKSTAKKSSKKTPKKASAKAAGKSKTTTTPKKSSTKKSAGATAKGSKSKSAKGAKASGAGESARSDAAVAAPTITLTDARAAASRLAAAAGLPSLKHRTPEAMAEMVAEKRLTKSPLNKRELDKFREILNLKRSEVAGDVFDMESEALGHGKGELSSLPQHMADQGSDEYDQSLSLGLAQSQRVLLKEIDAALARIEAKTYGVCEALGVPIPKERLNATPWARYSVEGARMVDRGHKPS
jgi:RNA polymerase-binding transcription factor DksA